MEVNGKLVKGIFLYDKEVKYTEGDFVVEGNKMYVCKEASLGHLPSTSPSQFKPYLGAPTTGEIENSSASFVSSYALGKYLSGTCNMKGTIPNNINSDREAFFRDFFGNESGLSLGDRYLDPLDNLIVSGINQTVVNVDKSVAEKVVGTCNNNPILRQYTYQSNPTMWTRVQELINVDSSDIYFRTSSKTVEGENVDDYPWSAPTEWKNVSVNGSYKNTIAQIKSYYTQKSYELDILKTKLLGSFRFKKAKITAGLNVTIPTADLLSSIVTVCIRTISVVEGAISQTLSVTVDLDSSILKYDVGEGITLSISKNSVSVSEGAEIYDVYVRIPFDYTPEPTPIQYMEDIPVTRMNSTTYRINTGPRLKTNFIKVSLSDTMKFVFPATQRGMSITTNGISSAIVVEKYPTYFEMRVNSTVNTKTVSAAYVNLS